MPLTRDEIESIRGDCFADDVEIDFSAMSMWNEAEARSYFENGGEVLPKSTESERNALLVSLGACLPNAPIPSVPLENSGGMGNADPDQAADGCEVDQITPNGKITASTSALPGRARIFCVSDLHTDHQDNLRWCRRLLPGGRFKQDVLIVAGDVTPSLVILQETLQVLRAAFAHVFFVPGNHDLWVKGQMAGGLHIRKQAINSIEKLHEILDMCATLGVHTKPAYAGGAIIAPLFAWYHPEFDTEPEIIGWDGMERARVASRLACVAARLGCMVSQAWERMVGLSSAYNLLS